MVDLTKTSIDFDDLVTELESDLQNRDTFKALFPGESSRVFTEHGAGITSLMLFNINSASQNGFMPTAFSKAAVYALATSLGQPPTRKLGATLTVTLTVNNTLAGAVNLPKFSRFSARGLEWYTTTDNLIPAGASGQTLDVTLRQGQRITENFTSNGKAFQRIEIGEDFSVDDKFLEVSVDALDYTNNGASLLTADAGSTVFAEQTTADGTVLILFGNVLFGTIPVIGADLEMRYAITAGVDSNSSVTGDNFNYLEIFALGGGEFLNLAGISLTTASGGSEEEDIDTVKNTSPRLFAANKRAVRRNDYEAFILTSTGAAAAKAFGEFEEAQLKGFADNSMMNRAFISAVPANLALQSSPAVSTGDGILTTFVSNVGSPNVMPGSVVLTSDVADFDDRDGRGILTSPSVSFNELAGGTATATDGGGTAGLAFDGAPLTNYEAGVIPTFNDAVRLSYDMGLGNEKTFKALRLQASGGSDCTVEARAFPSQIRVLASNVVAPDISTDTDWNVIRGYVVLAEPGAGGFSRWIPLDNPLNPETLVGPTAVAYRHIAIDIIDRYGTSTNVKIAEMEAMEEANTSPIDYNTGAFTLRYSTPPTGDIDASYSISNLTAAEKQDLIDFLNGSTTTDPLNHFTTLVIYRNAVARRIEVTADIFHLKGFAPSTVLGAVQTALDNLFATSTDSLGKPLFLADIYEAIQNVAGVDYVILTAPTGDFSFDFNEFPLLTNKTLSIQSTSR